MENCPPIPPDGRALADSRRLGHETSDARLRPIVLFVVVLTIVTILIHVAVWKYMHSVQRQNARDDLEPSPFVLDRVPPPEPRLQPSAQHPTEPHEDMEQLRKRWNEMLTTYGKVDGDPDRVRIPIDRAMAIVVERGLSTTRPSTQRATQPSASVSPKALTVARASSPCWRADATKTLCSNNSFAFQIVSTGWKPVPQLHFQAHINPERRSQ